MRKIFAVTITSVVILALIIFVVNSYARRQKQPVGAADYKNAEYVVGDQHIKLKDGVAETETAPGSASKTVTRYFGNDLKTDLNGDGREDVAFVLTQNTGGSGTFFYAVAALNTNDGYKGSDGYLLGDRIAPQSTNVSPNPRHKYVVVFNFSDRAPSDPMTAQPSIGKSVYLKINPTTMQWGIVEPNFEGESDSLPPAGGTVTVRGNIACLIKRTTGPQTQECAIGLKADNGDYYALRNLYEKDPTYILSQTGTTVEVSGTITYEEMRGPDGNPYDIAGVITIDSVRKQ